MYRKRMAPLCQLFSLLFLFFSFDANSQYQPSTPFREDSLAAAAWLKATSLRLEEDKTSLSGENKKYVAAQFQERFDQLKSMYEQQTFITDSEACTYLRNLLESIVSKNAVLTPLKPRVLFSKVYWPNASSFGEGTLVFNISLFNRLRNEAEAAFILCHELSHLYLDHSNQAIYRYINTVYSKDFQAELKDIKAAQFQQGKRIQGLVKKVSFDHHRHSRDHEREADSIALVFLKNTGYDVRASISVLQLLDTVDTEKYARQLHLSEQLNFEQYPFQKRWTRSRSISLGEAMTQAAETTADIEADSLKTHPDCAARILALQSRIAAHYQPEQKTFLINQVYFDTLVNRFDRERIRYCFQQQQTGRALFYSLQLFAIHPQEAWLATLIGNCYSALYTAQQQHYIGSCVDLPTAGQERTEYGLFLHYLQSLRLDEMLAEGYWFLEQCKPRFSTDEAFMKTYRITQQQYANANPH